MTLPEYIEAFDAPTGSNEPHGILYQIRGNVTNDKLTNFVIPTCSGSYNANPHDPIKWSDPWQRSSSSGYYQIEFKDRFVFPTHYSLKGYAGYFAKEWDLYGFNSGDTPTLLSSDTSVGSTYCGDSDSDYPNDNWGTFNIKNTPQKAYRFFSIHTSKISIFVIFRDRILWSILNKWSKDKEEEFSLL